MTELVVRLVFSLAVVLGLLLLCARVAGKRWQGNRSAMVQVLHRQQISRNAAVSVVNVGGRVLVLGTTDQEVRLLTELDAATVEDADLEGIAVDEPTLTLLPGGPAAVLLAESVDEPVEQPVEESPVAARPGRHAAVRATPERTPLAGSVLSVSTWKQAWGAVTGRAS